MRKTFFIIILILLAFIVGCSTAKTVGECEKLGSDEEISNCFSKIMDGITEPIECSQFAKSEFLGGSWDKVCISKVAGKPTELSDCGQYEDNDNINCVNAIAKESKAMSPEERIEICQSHKVQAAKGECVINVVVDILEKSPETKEKAISFCGGIDNFRDDCYSHIVRITGETSLKICNLMVYQPRKLDCIAKVAKNSGDSTVCELIKDGEMYDASGRFDACMFGVDSNYVKEISAKDCTDSDGGKNYFEKGEITGILESTGQSITFNDQCTSPTQVIEHYCDKGYIKTVEEYGTFCPAGKTCDDGACV